MIRLAFERAPHWLDLPHGVRVEVEPLTTAIAAAARNDALRRVAIQIDEARAADKAGQGADPLAFNAGNMTAAEGMATQYEIEALARFGIRSWEGVAGPDGLALPVTPAAVEAFARHPDIGPAFREAYRRSVEALAAEGEGFAPSSVGNGAGARTTAADAKADQLDQTESLADGAEPVPPL